MVRSVRGAGAARGAGGTMLARYRQNKLLENKLSSEVDLVRLRRVIGGPEPETLSNWKVGAGALRRDVPQPHSPEQWGAASGWVQAHRGSGAVCLSFAPLCCRSKLQGAFSHFPSWHRQAKSGGSLTW